MPPPSIFLAHIHSDKAFARRLSGDLAALGARIWIDEAQINAGDSLIGKIAGAIGEMDFLAVILSPKAVASPWIQHALEPVIATQLAANQVKVLPLLHRKCEVPTFLRGKLQVDFTDAARYGEAIVRLSTLIGLSGNANLADAHPQQAGLHSTMYQRPVQWYCIFCGNGPMPSYNDYLCTKCQKVRPFMGGSCTVCQCPACREFNLMLALYCEWCGVPSMPPSPARIQ